MCNSADNGGGNIRRVMNTILLNTISLDDGKVIKKGGSSGGGGGVTINNQDKVVDIVENGSTEVVADAGFTGLSKVSVNVNVPTGGGGSGLTGHADAEGLRAIGWTDEDIAYYQENGVNWYAEDDEYHKVTDDNKALYGVLTADNISTYKDRIVYLPKIDTSAKTSMSQMFYNCYSLVAIPQLDTSNVRNMGNMFSYCYSLVVIPPLDTHNVTNMSGMFENCYSLASIPQLDTSNVTTMAGIFGRCYSLVSIPQLNTQKVYNMDSMFANCAALVNIPPLDTRSAQSMSRMFYFCASLVSIPQLDMQRGSNVDEMFYFCRNLTFFNLKNAKASYKLEQSALLSKESLLYLINNEAATSAITIKLASYAYNKWSVDADVIAALEAHPNISISA